jgi:hypothetical protein
MAAKRAAGPLMLLIWSHLRRIVSRFASLAAWAAAGDLAQSSSQ